MESGARGQGLGPRSWRLVVIVTWLHQTTRLVTGTSEQPKPRRGPGKPFVKGDPRIQPGGVPKWLAAIKREMESLGPEAVHFIAGVMRGEIKDAKVTIEGERNLGDMLKESDRNPIWRLSDGPRIVLDAIGTCAECRCELSNAIAYVWRGKMWCCRRCFDGRPTSDTTKQGR